MICLTSESLQKQSTQKKDLVFIHLYMDMLKGTSTNAGPHYLKFSTQCQLVLCINIKSGRDGSVGGDSDRNITGTLKSTVPTG
jgi:hypothetical protein